MPSSLGPAEILVILVVALIVLGPSRLPEAGRQVGRALSEIRRWSQDVKSEMRTAIDPDGGRPTYSTPMPSPVETPAPTPAPAPAERSELEPHTEPPASSTPSAPPGAPADDRP